MTQDFIFGFQTRNNDIESDLDTEEEMRLLKLLAKCLQEWFLLGNANTFSRGVFNFNFERNYECNYIEVLIDEGYRELRIFYKTGSIVVSAMSEEDVDTLSTMALMVL